MTKELFIVNEDPRESDFTLNNDDHSRSWIARTFGTLNHGSLRLGIITLINTAVGAGMLSLSASVANFGYLIGTAMFFVGAANLYLGLYSFKYLMFKYPNTCVYSDLV